MVGRAEGSVLAVAGDSLNNQAVRVAQVAKQADDLFAFLTVESFDATNFSFIAVPKYGKQVRLD